MRYYFCKCRNLCNFAKFLKVCFVNYLQKIHELKVFTLEDFEAIAPSQRAAQELLRVYSHKGYVKKVRRNLYCAADLATGENVASKFAIGSHIARDSYICYHSALEFHGLAHQQFFQVNVISSSRFNEFEYDGLTYRFSPFTITGGVVTPELNRFIRVTDLERTVVDCIDKIVLAGGLEELLHALSIISYLDEKKLRQYLKEYDKKVLYKKSGFLLSQFNDVLKLKPSFFSLCHRKSDSVLGVLTDRQESDKYNSVWNLYVPESIESYLMQGHYDLV